MSDVLPWIEEKIAEHRPGPDRDPVALQRLLSACAALVGRGGTVFGLAPPAEGFPESSRLYQECCGALQDWLAVIDDADLAGSLIAAIRRNGLEVAIPRHLRTKQGEPRIDLSRCGDRADAIGDIASVVRRLESAEIDVAVSVTEVASNERIEAACGAVRPRVPESFIRFAEGFPARVELEWSTADGSTSGALLYDLSRVEDLWQECADQVADSLEGLEHYYGVWVDAFPFMETGEGAGFIALDANAEIVYLDNEGNTDINGTKLAPSINDFWKSWVALCFVALQPETVEMVARSGFGRNTPIEVSVRSAVGPEPG